VAAALLGAALLKNLMGQDTPPPQGPALIQHLTEVDRGHGRLSAFWLSSKHYTIIIHLIY
jgi:hypothetical protein